MSEWPRVDVVVITYNRPLELQKTILALHKRIDYPKDRLRYLIADDATPLDHGASYDSILRSAAWFDAIYTACGDNDKAGCVFVPHSGMNVGWGANANRALRYSDAPYILQIEDDYVLRKDLDLRAAVATMEVTPHMGMMRFRGTAGDHLIYHQMEARIEQWLPDHQDGVGLPGRLSYFLIDSGSPGLYIYSHGLHLKRANFHTFYGPYPEGLKLGHTEESYAHTVKDLMRSNPYAPVLCIQPEWIAMWLDHIGKSYQLTELDKEH